MYPCPSRGYMPFVPNNHQGDGEKKQKKGNMKKYQVTLRDRKGCTYTYIVKAEDANSIPLLCEAKVVGLSKSNKCLVVTSHKNGASHKAHAALRLPIQLPVKDSDGGQDDKKTGLLHSILKFFKEKTGIKSKKSPKNPKSKRRTTQIPQRKRQRTVSLKSNLDPIEESPEEEEEEEEGDGLDEVEEDDLSYNHDSNSDSDSLESGSSSEVSSLLGAEGLEIDDDDDDDTDSGDDGDTEEGSERAETTPEP